MKLVIRISLLLLPALLIGLVPRSEAQTQPIINEHFPIRSGNQLSPPLVSVLRNYWRRALHRRFSDERLRARRHRCEEIFVMQSGQDRFSKDECTRRQSMSRC